MTTMSSSSPSPPLPASSGPKTLDATTTLPPPQPSSDSLHDTKNESDRPDLSYASGDEAAAAIAGEAESSGGVEGPEGEEVNDDDEEYECGFCLFMKGGGCKEAFIAWENCMEETHKTREDAVDKCFEVTALLKKCMDAHADYYEPILRAEQALSDAVEAPDAPETKEPESKD